MKPRRAVRSSAQKQAATTKWRQQPRQLEPNGGPATTSGGIMRHWAHRYIKCPSTRRTAYAGRESGGGSGGRRFSSTAGPGFAVQSPQVAPPRPPAQSEGSAASTRDRATCPRAPSSPIGSPERRGMLRKCAPHTEFLRGSRGSAGRESGGGGSSGALRASFAVGRKLA